MTTRDQDSEIKALRERDAEMAAKVAEAELKLDRLVELNHRLDANPTQIEIKQMLLELRALMEEISTDIRGAKGN